MPPRAKSTKATKAAAATADAAFADIAPPPTPAPAAAAAPPKTPRAKAASTRKTSGTAAGAATATASKTDTVKRTRKPRAKKETAIKTEENEGDDTSASHDPSLEDAEEKKTKPAPVRRKRATKKATADAAFARIKQEEEDEAETSSQEPSEAHEPQEPDYSYRALAPEVKTEEPKEEEDGAAAVAAAPALSDNQQVAAASPTPTRAPSALATLPLPGAFAPEVDTFYAMRAVVVAAIASSALSVVARVGVDALATTPALAEHLPAWGPAWASYLSIMELPGVWTPVAALAIRLCKLTLGWGSFSHVVALDVLSYGPIVYLLACFYYVPLPAAVVSVAIDLVADVIPLALWQWYAGGAAVEAKEEDGSEEGQDAQDPPYLNDPASFTYSATYAGVLYAFVFVQACRFFLPYAFVVHYLGIATVEPARPVPLSSTAPTTLYEVFVSVFLSYAALSLNFVSGIAARAFIFAGAGAGRAENSAYGYSTAVAIRSVSLAVVVGVNVFLQVFLGIQGVDAVGAAAYASIWAAAPLLVGAGLGLIGA